MLSQHLTFDTFDVFLQLKVLKVGTLAVCQSFVANIEVMFMSW